MRETLTVVTRMVIVNAGGDGAVAPVGGAVFLEDAIVGTSLEK